MYKFKSKQISFSDFGQPVGMEMNPDNRWINKAAAIPWAEIEMRYANLFVNRKGNVAKPLRLALGSLIIQMEYGFSDEETALMIQENPYLQFFCGFAKYEYKLPFDPSLMVHFRKRLTPAIVGEINELIIKKAITEKSKKEDDSSQGPGISTQDDNDGEDNADEDDSSQTPEITSENEADENIQIPEPFTDNEGTLIVDATCAPSDIKYPQDIELLNRARENTEEMITQLHDPKDGRKPRTYKKQACKDYLTMVRKKRKTAREIRKGIRKQLQYLERNLRSIGILLGKGKTLIPKWQKRLGIILSLFEQQKYMFDNHTHSVESRIVSLSQPHLRPIVRGKIKAPVEFGAKLDISVCDGFVRLEKQSFEAYNEATTLKAVIERFKERTGKYPDRILADKIYRNRDNLAYCKERGIRLSGPALGRPKKNEKPDRKQDYKDICERVEVERKFSFAKLNCGLGRIYTRLAETTESVIALSFLVVNLKKICHDLATLFLRILLAEIHHEKLAFIQ